MAWRVQLGDWASLAAGARPLREAVFVQEQQVPVELEWDDDDATALHALAHAADGRAVGTGRLLVHGLAAARCGRIGRMAVRRECRGTGVGAALLDALVNAARARGDRMLLLHAQCSAQGFYARAGFQPHGPVFEEAGIDHIEMRRLL